MGLITHGSKCDKTEGAVRIKAYCKNCLLIPFIYQASLKIKKTNSKELLQGVVKVYEEYGARLLKTEEHTNTGLLVCHGFQCAPCFQSWGKTSASSVTHTQQSPGKIEGKFSITLHILFCVKKSQKIEYR